MVSRDLTLLRRSLDFNMALYSNKKSFSDQLSDIQSVFQTAKTKAKALADQMASEKANKEAQMAKIQDEINTIAEVETRNNAFIENLDKLTL